MVTWGDGNALPGQPPPPLGHLPVAMMPYYLYTGKFPIQVKNRSTLSH